MNKKRERKLFDAITNIMEDMVEETQKYLGKKEKKNHKWKAWALLAASFLLVFGLGSFMIWQGLLPIGGGSSFDAGDIGGSSYDGEDLSFMSYSGPVLPLSLDEENENIRADRHIVYDFSLKHENSIRVKGAQVKEQYTLTNTSDKDIEVNINYPFVSSYNELGKNMPKIFIDDREIYGNLYPGSYKNLTEEKPEHDTLTSWEDYKSFLGDESYKENAFSAYPTLDQKVIVYEFTDFQGPLDKYKAATQAISFEIGVINTRILHHGFNGIKWDDGFREYSYFLPNPEYGDKRENRKLLIVYGEDIGEYELQGYKDGGTEKGNELEGASVNISRYESVLSNVIEDILDEEYFKNYDNNILNLVSKETFLGSLAEFFYHNNILTFEVSGWYESEGLMTMANEVNVMDRVFYLEYPIKIGKGESLFLEVDLYKKGSFDFSGSGTKKEGLQGYDLASKLGSNLKFHSLSADIKSTENIEIIRQNFGFDIKKDITKINLNPSVEYYYMEIRPVE